MNAIQIIDLKGFCGKDEDFIAQYVNLRNSYADLLLTSPVEIDETREWLKNADIEIRGIVEDNILCGVTILYLNRQGEVAFFVREPGRGLGTRLLEIIERVALEKGLTSVWAWVLHDNHIAQRAFEKNGYLREGTAEREFNNRLFKGFRFGKKLKPAGKGENT